MNNTIDNLDEIQKATLGGGCFWCIEAVLQTIEGIISITSGFCGGTEPNPSYELACSGKTDHIEVVDLEFNASVISYDDILSIFFHSHDPTQANGQGYDIGPQYRSVIFYHNQEQRQACQQLIKHLTESQYYTAPIVTSIRPAMPFYAAPLEHQNFYQRHQQAPYCQMIIDPKLRKIRQSFANKLKSC